MTPLGDIAIYLINSTAANNNSLQECWSSAELQHSQRWHWSVILTLIFIVWSWFEEALHELRSFIYNSSCSDEASVSRSFRWSGIFERHDRTKKYFVFRLLRRNLDSGGHKSAVNRMTVTQHTLLSTCHNSCCTEFSSYVQIQYPCLCMERRNTE